MAEINHDFLLLSKAEQPYGDYLQWLNHPTAIQVPDDLLAYLSDTLKWVVCYNPGNKMTKHIGLNWYGPSVIKQDGAMLLKQIFENWASLFANSPDSLHLTGNFRWNDGQTNGQYERLVFNRDDSIKTFRTLAGYAKQVANSQDDLYILHLGL